MQDECDGSTYNGTRNCDKKARWSVADVHACDQHLAQIVRDELGGEQGTATVVSRYTDER